MAFWSSQTLSDRFDTLIEIEGTPMPIADEYIDCNSIELSIGEKIFVTPNLDEVNNKTRQSLKADEAFNIPPGQFGFLMTDEIVKVPSDTMAFISIKAKSKLKGLVNISGFHVDPGWEGPLIFSVFNAGPSPIRLHRGKRLFLIWYADLDKSSDKKKSGTKTSEILDTVVGDITGAQEPIYEVQKRLEKKIEDLNESIHLVKNTQTGMVVTFSVLSTILLGLVVILSRSIIQSWISN